MRLRTKLAALAVTAGVAVTATAAFAAWTASGTGNGTAKAISARSLVVSAAAVSDLYPGSSSDLPISINNPNPYKVQVSVTQNGVIDSNGSAACDASTGVSFTPPAADQILDPGDNTLHGTVSMSNASHNDCQGATFTIPLSADGASYVAP